MCKKYFIEILKKLLTKAISHIIINRLSEREQIAYVGMYVVHIYGGIAQLARVLGSYPIGRRFESHCRYQIQHTYLLKVLNKRAFSPSYMARWSSG